jgi:hypothetical protein
MESQLTASASRVVVTYVEFLERCERRRRVDADLGRPRVQASLDAEPVVVAVAKPLVPEQKYPCRVKNAEA